MCMFQFTIYGWNSCHSIEWLTVYSGYAMAVVSNNSGTEVTSEPLCMDEDPNDFQVEGRVGYGTSLRLLFTDYGFFYPNKPIPCAVCIK